MQRDRKTVLREVSAKLPQAIQRTAAIKLKMLNAVNLLETLRVPPSNYLEALHFDGEGQHRIRINEQWRIRFIWQGNDAHNVEMMHNKRLFGIRCFGA